MIQSWKRPPLLFVKTNMGDTLRLEKPTEQDHIRDRAQERNTDVEVVVRDSVYVGNRDSMLVQTNTNLTNPTNKKSTIVTSFQIIVLVIALIIVIKNDFRFDVLK